MDEKPVDSKTDRPAGFSMEQRIEHRLAARKPELREVENEDGVKTVTLVGYASVFGKPSDPVRFGRGDEDLLVEYMDEKAFDDVLAGDPDVPCLFNHDSRYVLGRTKSGTLRLSKDKVGLRYEVDLPDTPLVRDMVLEPIKRGDIDKSSVGFVFKSDSWKRTEAGGYERTYRSVDRLLDVSPVTTPAFPDTSVALRSFERWASDSAVADPVADADAQDDTDDGDDTAVEEEKPKKRFKREMKDLKRKIESLTEQRDAALAQAKVLLDRLKQIIKED